jgi:putative phosphoribosyl transferase
MRRSARSSRGVATRLSVDSGAIEGDLVVPDAARGIVVFAHGSGSSRHSTRNRRVAEALRAERFGTLLFDLLTAAEERGDERTRALRFDIDLLAERLTVVTDALGGEPSAHGLPLGYFGASTGAGAALAAAAMHPGVRAVVSRGGRPDLAGVDALRRVRTPTLLIVGELDREVLALNREAQALLGGPNELVIIPGATHLFEEPGALDEVARLAARHFTRYV